MTEVMFFGDNSDTCPLDLGWLAQNAKETLTNWLRHLSTFHQWLLDHLRIHFRILLVLNGLAPPCCSTSLTLWPQHIRQASLSDLKPPLKGRLLCGL